MIQKLRRKFILVNMSLVSLVLLIVFTSIGIFTYQRLSDDSVLAMERVLDFKQGEGPEVTKIGKKPGSGPDRKRMPLVPVFAVTLDENGNIKEVFRENVAVEDELLNEVVARVLESGGGYEAIATDLNFEKNEGVFLDQKLRYLVRSTPDGLKIAFADTNKEFEEMLNTFSTLFLVGVGGLLSFFMISVYLSRWVLKPVERAWEQQKRFVADASHELKTPLTVILANMGILLSHKSDTVAGQVKWVEYTQTEAMRMKTLVEDLLFLAKTDSGQNAHIKSEVNLSEALWTCLLPFESVAYERGVNMETDIQEGVTLNGDEGQLKQLVLILADNACKYAGVDGQMHVSLRRRGDGVELKVNNTGQPIPKEDLAQIFDRFYRVDHSRAREQGGYGLGLSIAQAIVKQHGGKIQVESNEVNGTTFTVHF